jgi:hypothetical protein
VVARLARLAAQAAPVRLEAAYRRSRVGRAEIARALAGYFREAVDPARGFYEARVDGDQVTTSILVEPGWLDAAVRLSTEQERFQLEVPTVSLPRLSLEGPALEAALMRLAMVEVSGTVLVNTPLYRLLDVAIERHRLRGTVSVTDFASNALTMDLLETELLDALAGDDRMETVGRVHPLSLPLRETYLPTLDAALNLRQRFCYGGPVALFAAARGRTRSVQEPDYVLLIQERSARVLNAKGRLAVVPKSFHEPTVEAGQEVQLSASLERELEEELLGRQDLEGMTAGALRRADPFHEELLTEPMRWLLKRRGTDAYRLECTGFGINMVSGNYEFPSLILIEDEEWWTRFGGRVEANWEMERIHRYSSRDTAGLRALISDLRWSNEGLFSFLEGLRRLREVGSLARLALPTIEVANG